VLTMELDSSATSGTTRACMRSHSRSERQSC
jgi:hypothetical protein